MVLLVQVNQWYSLKRWNILNASLSAPYSMIKAWVPNSPDPGNRHFCMELIFKNARTTMELYGLPPSEKMEKNRPLTYRAAQLGSCFQYQYVPMLLVNKEANHLPFNGVLGSSAQPVWFEFLLHDHSSRGLLRSSPLVRESGVQFHLQVPFELLIPHAEHSTVAFPHVNHLCMFTSMQKTRVGVGVDKGWW